VRRSHETWFHLTRQPRYYSAVDEIREPHVYPHDARWERQAGGSYASHMNGHINSPLNPLGKLPGSVWEVATEPLRVPEHLGIDHFAAFPSEWPRRIITGWSPPGICVECGEGRRPVVGKSGARPVARAHRHLPGYRDPAGEGTRDMTYDVLGYACACPEPTAPTRPAVVVDPFGGTGTTALVASVLGRTGVSVDRSMDYSRLATWRTTDPGERARAMRVPKPPPVLTGQPSLFDTGGGEVPDG
jgi:hypothetical protein